MNHGVSSILELFSNISDELRLVLMLLAIVNVLGFVAVLWDKSKREQDEEDYVPYPVLIVTAFCGGTLGILIAFKIFGYSFKSNAQMMIVVGAVLSQIYIISQYKDWILYNL